MSETAGTEIWFYHLQSKPLEAVLPQLLERSLQRGWSVVVQAVTPERVAALDDLLWTYSDEGFLPHATDREPDAARERVVLTAGDGNPNGATVRFLVEGARLPATLDGLTRLVLLFDGNDEAALAAARGAWAELRKAGRQPTYWQQDEDGRWQKKA
ncbi:DNA polymerase III subunit chi [Alsobacter sp. R-9]